MHWINEYDDRLNCNGCKTVNQCKASFKLGVEEFDHDKDGKLLQHGHRFKLKKCFAKEVSKYFEYLQFYYNYKRLGLPYRCGWAEMPLCLFQILNELEVEAQYMRKKNG